MEVPGASEQLFTGLSSKAVRVPGQWNSANKTLVMLSWDVSTQGLTTQLSYSRRLHQGLDG